MEKSAAHGQFTVTDAERQEREAMGPRTGKEQTARQMPKRSAARRRATVQ
jgi:hypothetical protein